MSYTLWILTLINIASFIGMFVILRKVNESLRRQVNILGEKHKKMILNRFVMVSKLAYVVFVLLIVVISYLIIN